MSVVCICLFVILPLTLVGTILGRNISGQPDHPCRVNTVPRPIPEKKWYGDTLHLLCIAMVSKMCWLMETMDYIHVGILIRFLSVLITPHWKVL